MEDAQKLAQSIINRSIIRAGKGFVAGGVASMAMVPIFAGDSIHDFKTWITSMAIAFFVGGVLGIEKLLSQTYGSNTNSTVTPQTTIEEVSQSSYVFTQDSTSQTKNPQQDVVQTTV